jgi:hypothetical protein
MLFFQQVLNAIIFVFLSFASCRKPAATGNEQPFTSKPSSVPVMPGIVDEASGIADSYTNEGSLWIQQDSGNPPDLQLLKEDGTYLKSVHIKGAVNRDWEDLVIAKGPGAGQYLYVGDIGDNNAVYHLYHIYRFQEPKPGTDTVYTFEKLTFQYSDGPHDAEAFLVDNKSLDIYVITKREQSSIIFKIAYPQSPTTTNQALPVDTLPLTGAVSAALSPDQKELIIKTYTRLYYWKKKKNESLEEMFRQSPQVIDYEMEPQGEAICFKKDNNGFFTLSEKALSASVSLKFYKRN